MPLAKGFGVAFGLAAGSALAGLAFCAAEVVAHPATKVTDRAKATAEAERMEWRSDKAIAFWLTMFVVSGNTKS